jgi:multisubunit Na+/H+ antiporter MnhG subunit
LTSVKILLIAVFMFLAQPTATHAISRAAYRCEVQPWACELDNALIEQGGEE